MRNRDVKLTPELIKSVTDRFSLSAAFVLEMPGLNISDMSALEECINLQHLNLSFNSLTSIQGLLNAEELTYLNLSNNQIASLEGLRSCKKLEKLEIQGNRVSVFNQISLLSSLPSLQHLFLQNYDGSEPNPICSQDRYRNQTLEALPRLKNLDGHRTTLPLLSRNDLRQYEIDPNIFNVRLDNKPWIAPFNLSSTSTSGDKELDEMIKECRSLLGKGEQILASIKDK
jgi:Leucine-rich repeat (LRR) protein